MDFKVEVKGLRELESKLKQLEPKIARRIAIGAVSSGAKVIREQAEANARSKFHRRTGLLFAGIGQRASVKKFLQGSQILVRIGMKKVGAKGRPFYARFLEFGHNHYGRAPRGKAGRAAHPISPKPFFAPAFQQKAEAAIQRIAEVLRQRLGEAVR